MVMQDRPGVLERLGLAYLRQHRAAKTERAWSPGPPTQLSHCPNLGLASHLITQRFSFQMKATQARNGQNYVTN